MKPEIPQQTVETASRLPLSGWGLELARRWNSGSYSLFVLHGNIFDVFPIQDGERVEYLSLKAFLARRLFPQRDTLLFYDIGDGLTFGSADEHGFTEDMGVELVAFLARVVERTAERWPVL